MCAISRLMGGSVCAVLRRSFAAIILAGLSTPALAAYTNLYGQVSTSFGGTQQQNYPDNPSAALSGLLSHDAVGNDASGSGTMASLAGTFSLSTHACSGGQSGWGGQANAMTHADVTQDYRVESTTLEPGTPVSLQIRWAVNGSETAAGSLTYHGYGASGSLDGHVSITVGGVSIVNKSGSRRREYNVTNGYTHLTFGVLNVEEDQGDYTVTALVGQQLRIFMSGTSSGVSIAGGTDVADGDSQMAMSWGVTSLNPAAAVVSLTYPGGYLAPPADNATPEQNLPRVPPRPSNLPVCFSFTEQPVAANECVSSDAGFAVSTSGAGPFTYLWRRNGVPLNTGVNPSAATAALSLPSIAAADAGSYTCVVTNPCGDRTSDAATLTVAAPLPGDVNADGLVDGEDVQAFVNLIGAEGPPGPYFCAADLDVSGVVDTADVPPFVAQVLGP